MRATVRQCSGVQQADQRRSLDAQQFRRLLRREIVRTGRPKFGDRADLHDRHATIKPSHNLAAPANKNRPALDLVDVTGAQLERSCSRQRRLPLRTTAPHSSGWRSSRFSFKFNLNPKLGRRSDLTGKLWRRTRSVGSFEGPDEPCYRSRLASGADPQSAERNGGDAVVKLDDSLAAMEHDPTSEVLAQFVAYPNEVPRVLACRRRARLDFDTEESSSPEVNNEIDFVPPSLDP